VLEQKSHRVYVATALAALVLFSATAGFGNSAAAAELDSFGVEKIYQTKQGGNEWYVNMDDPTSTLRNVRNVAFEKNPDGSWHVSARQIRMEAWSPSNEKWHNVEITMYAKMDAGTSASDLLQMYSRGGHHSSRDPCSGSAYKARLYEDGRAAWTKEVTHPAYANNRDVEHVTGSIEGKWVGFKAVIYNVVEDGQTYVRLESYIDDNVTDENGNLVIRNNWKLASVVEDKGGWATPDSDFMSACGLARDAILSGPGGSGDQNIVAWRSDNIGWSFKYLSAREIDPLGEHQTPVVGPEQPVPEEEVPPVDEEPVDESTSLAGYEKVASKQVQSDGDTAISSVDMQVKKKTSRTSGTIVVGLMLDGDVVAVSEPIGASQFDSIQYATTAAVFSPSIQLTGSYEISVYYQGSGGVQATIVS
jgi:hypothetical protein